MYWEREKKRGIHYLTRFTFNTIDHGYVASEPDTKCYSVFGVDTYQRDVTWKERDYVDGLWP